MTGRGGAGRRPARPGQRGAGKPRIEEVAQEAGTSTITVSRALRRPEKVTAATRARVMAAVEALGYVPNLAASSLASQRSGIVAVIVPTLGNSVFAATLQGLSDAVTARGLQLLVGDSGYSDAAALALIEAFAGRQPDGIAVVGVLRDPRIRRRLAALGAPVVETWDLTDDPIDCVVGFSNYRAGEAMTRFLAERGYRRIAFLGGGDDRARSRHAGYRAALAQCGLDYALDLALDEPFSFGAGRRAMGRLAVATPRPDALFCATDVLAVGTILECQHLGIRVPGALAIAGLGDLEIAGALTPALTTVHIPAYEIGRRAGEMLLQRVAGEDVEPRIVDLGFGIRARDSA